jgi:hypothetical protein
VAFIIQMGIVEIINFNSLAFYHSSALGLGPLALWLLEE